MFGGGYSPQPSTVNTVGYNNRRTGDTVDYGDLVNKGRGFASYASSTRRVLHCEDTHLTITLAMQAITSVIQFTTITHAGNFSDFGDATTAKDFVLVDQMQQEYCFWWKNQIQQK